LARTPSAAKLDPPKDSGDTAEALEDSTRRLDWKFETGGYIDFIGAGRQGGTYSERVNTFDWRRFYELGGANVLTALKAHLHERYDWVLIDSRTGVSDSSGICTIQMPEAVVACFTLNRQSIEGVTAVLRSIRAFRSASVDGSAIDFFPLATRIENAEQARLEVARGHAREAFSDLLPKGVRSSPREYWDKMEIAYRPAYAFEEILAAFGDSTGAAGAADTMVAQVETTAQCITGDRALVMPEITASDRARVLAKYAFGALPAVTRASSIDDAADTDFLRGVRAKEQLWRKSTFSWRRLLSRRELDLITDEDQKGFGRNMAFYMLESKRMQRFLRKADTGAVVNLVLAAAVSLGLYVLGLKDRASVPFMISNAQMADSVYVFLIAWPVFAFIWGAFVARDRPYGLRWPRVFMLTLLGPLRGDIRDYEPGRPSTSSELTPHK
jgi:hypothetical protein